MSKESVFALLYAHRGEFLSGEAISEQLGTTRAAVWKSISALRRDGCAVEAVTGRGYRLTDLPDDLSARAIRAHLGTVETVGRRIDSFSTIDSTNTYLRREAVNDAPDGTVAVAEEQTAGRGRRGRSFQSVGGKGVYLSVLLRPELAPDALLPLTGLCAVAMCEAVERACGVRPQIKWTNDLILNGKKLGGILTELSVEGETGMLQYVIVGIGVNANQSREDFEGEVADMATSAALETGKHISRAALAAAMIEELDRLYAALKAGDLAPYVASYRRGCVTIGREVQLLWQDTREKVTALDVDDQFGLVVRRGSGAVETIRTGEVSVRGLYGYVE